MVRRVIGRLPSLSRCTLTDETRPSSGLTSCTRGEGTEVGSSTTTLPSGLRKLVQTSGALASRSTQPSGAPSPASTPRFSLTHDAGPALPPAPPPRFPPPPPRPPPP